MSLFFWCCRRAIGWSLTFVFYLSTLLAMYSTFDIPLVIRITFSMIAGALVTETYIMWREQIRCYLEKRRKRDQ